MRTLILLCLVVVSQAASGQGDGSGLQISAGVDVVGEAGFRRNSGATDKITAREVEITLYAPADHLLDGMLSFAAHGDEGPAIPNVELHEAWLGSTKLIPRSRFRLGLFFLGVGRLNQYHRHDWPFISAPRVHREFFGAEAALDTGAEYSILLPTPFFLELTAGMTNGFVFGHDHSAGSRPLMPTNYARLVTYTSLPSDGGAQIGLNYLGRRGNEGTGRTMLGVDFTAKWRETKVTQFLLQSEVWYRSLTPRGSDLQNALGFYVYPNYYLGGDLFAGLRLDFFSTINQKDAFGASVKNFELGAVPTLTWKPSEFSTFRLAYNVKPEYERDRFVRTNHYLEAQASIILGAHPAHDF